MITFEEYLAGKKIDSAAFRNHETKRWETYKLIFEQVHPESFTTQKKFVLNDLRRQYLLKEIAPLSAVASEKKVTKPVMRPAVSQSVETAPEQIVSSETEKPLADETTTIATEPPALKQGAKPVMRPMVKKAPEAMPESIELTQTPLEEIPKKPARPVMKPVMKKPVIQRPDEEPTESIDDGKIVSPEEQKPAELPVNKPVMKRPVMRPVIKKPDSEKSSD